MNDTERADYAILKRIGAYLKDLTPAAIREIIVVFIILCLSIALSLPQYHEDLEEKRKWEQMGRNHGDTDQQNRGE